jgi:hypothetical protein
MPHMARLFASLAIALTLGLAPPAVYGQQVPCNPALQVCD